MIPSKTLSLRLAALLLTLAPASLRAQWINQTFSLVPGWNAVYLNVDPGYTTIDALIGADPKNPIQEVWLWSPPPGAAQFVTSLPSPSTSAGLWSTWNRSSVSGNTLSTLQGNHALLVRTTNAYSWNLLGQPLAPALTWNSSGLNFIGFPANGATPPTFDAYFSPAPTFETTAQIFQYVGGSLGAGNPLQIFSYPTTPLQRGRAYWVRSPNYNDYFGPFTVTATGGAISFGTHAGQSSITLNNTTAAPLTVYLNLIASAPAPAGMPKVTAAPPLLVRSAINTTNLSYGYSVLNGATNFPVTLQPLGQPGASAQVVLGLNRSAISGGAPGDLVAGVLRLTDDGGLTQIDLPVSAIVGGTTGLWVGQAAVSGVNQYVNTYYTATNDLQLQSVLAQLNLTNGAGGVTYQVDPSTSRIMAFHGGPGGFTNGVFLFTSSTLTNGAVPTPYVLRLVAHSGTNQARGGPGVTLLHHVYVGPDINSNTIVTVTTNLLDSNRLSLARRITAVHFPWSGDSTNFGWFASGAALGSASPVVVSVPLNYNDHGANPFVHTYHPDHDNLDAKFAATLPAGVESFNINRTIRLYFTPPSDDFASLTGSAGKLQGMYQETIQIADDGIQSRNFDVYGSFTLNQITEISTLRTQ
jgi:hypothetical protein